MLIWIQQYFGVTNRGVITVIVMVVCAAILIGWDIYIVYKSKSGEHDTISEVTNKQARLHPLLPFAAGVLVGHFFWTIYVCWSGCVP